MTEQDFIHFAMMAFFALIVLWPTKKARPWAQKPREITFLGTDPIDKSPRSQD